MLDLEEKPKPLSWDKAEVILVIADMFLDAAQDDVDFISDREIMHFLGVPDQQLLDMPEETHYNIRIIKENWMRLVKTQQSFVLYEALEPLLENGSI